VVSGDLTLVVGTFENVTGLVANCQNLPISCEDLDLDDILHPFPTTRTAFPMRYLGLPLSVTRLTIVDLQCLENKITGEFASENWININMSPKASLGSCHPHVPNN
jgi:hypothetical protein